MRTPIIDQPNLQNPWRKTIYTLITAVFWLLWFVLWLPLIAFFISSYVDGEPLSPLTDSVNLHSYLSHSIFIQTMIWSAIAILLFAIMIWLWSFYHLHHVGRRNRRYRSSPLHRDELASYFHVHPNDLIKWQRAKRVIIKHNQPGLIKKVSVLNSQSVTHFNRPT